MITLLLMEARFLGPAASLPPTLPVLNPPTKSFYVFSTTDMAQMEREMTFKAVRGLAQTGTEMFDKFQRIVETI